MVTIHRGTQVNSKTKKNVVCLYVLDEGEIVSLQGADIFDWVRGIAPQTEIRTTFVHHGDLILQQLWTKRHARLRYMHWHNTGIPAGLAVLEILQRYAALPGHGFRDFEPRQDLFNLAIQMARYHAVTRTLKAYQQRKKAIARCFGLPKMEQKSAFEGPDQDIEVGMESKLVVYNDLKAIAETIPECIAFKAAADIRDKWVLAAEVVTSLGPPDRFWCHAAIHRFAGQGVVDGQAEKMHKGETAHYDPDLKSQLYAASLLWCQDGNRWEPVYRQYRLLEDLAHPQKHPGCKTPDGHCHRMAMRKVVKEILSEWANRCGFAGLRSFETHGKIAGKGVASQSTIENHEKVAATPTNFARNASSGA